MANIKLRVVADIFIPDDKKADIAKALREHADSINGFLVDGVLASKKLPGKASEDGIYLHIHEDGCVYCRTLAKYFSFRGDDSNV